MKRITLGVGLSLLSFVTITMFQNCAQPGSLQMSEQEAYAAGAMDIVAMGAIESSDILAIIPPETAPALESQPAAEPEPEAMDRDIASEPVVTTTTPTVSPTNDRDSEEVATPVTTTSPSQDPAPAPTPEKEEQVATTDNMPKYETPAPPVSEPTAPVIEQTVSTPAPAPAPEEPVVSTPAPAPAPAPEEPVVSTPAPAPEQPVATATPEDTDAPTPVMEPAVCSKERELMTDIKLHVASIQGVDLKGVQISIVDQQPFITTESRKIKIKASKDATLDKVNLVLDQSGNLVLFSNNTYAELKTPSAQQSGLKVHLDSAIAMKAGKTYELLLQFELADQLVVAGKKCLFKPVIHTGNLSLASQ